MKIIIIKSKIIILKLRRCN